MLWVGRGHWKVGGQGTVHSFSLHMVLPPSATSELREVERVSGEGLHMVLGGSWGVLWVQVSSSWLCPGLP